MQMQTYNISCLNSDILASVVTIKWNMAELENKLIVPFTSELFIAYSMSLLFSWCRV